MVRDRRKTRFNRLLRRKIVERFGWICRDSVHERDGFAGAG